MSEPNESKRYEVFEGERDDYTGAYTYWVGSEQFNNKAEAQDRADQLNGNPKQGPSWMQTNESLKLQRVINDAASVGVGVWIVLGLLHTIVCTVDLGSSEVSKQQLNAFLKVRPWLCTAFLGALLGITAQWLGFIGSKNRSKAFMLGAPVIVGLSIGCIQGIAVGWSVWGLTPFGVSLRSLPTRMAAGSILGVFSVLLIMKGCARIRALPTWMFPLTQKGADRWQWRLMDLDRFYQTLMTTTDKTQRVIRSLVGVCTSIVCLIFMVLLFCRYHNLDQEQLSLADLQSQFGIGRLALLIAGNLMVSFVVGGLAAFMIYILLSKK